MTEDRVILVDTSDRPVGIMEKMEAHLRGGRLHRAFSVFVFNYDNEFLLQRRALTKYHSGGLWTNTCCSHPRPGEETIEAGKRRIMEELGISCKLREAFSFTYKATLDNETTEYEFDHVLIGRYDGELHLNPEEVDSIKWLCLSEIRILLNDHPEEFTVWFRIAFERVEKYMQNIL
ncbi:MAG: isopentenyl-diphosphate Delta-isomerase [Bacteroidota bacterium]|nr:isopentenyl-diphosphate Delta-isomerase [Bacteroidota bacterium]